MKIGSLSAAWSDQPLEEVLDFFAEAGLESVEIGSGNYPGTAHCDPVELNRSAKKRGEFMKAIESRGLILSALSCHGNPLHPKEAIAKEHHEAWRETVKLAPKLGLDCVKTTCGRPGRATTPFTRLSPVAQRSQRQRGPPAKRS